MNGEWSVVRNHGHCWPITEIACSDGRVLVFEPPDIVFYAGGQRLRVEDVDTDSPVLAIERFDRSIDRHRMHYRSDGVS